MDVATHAMTGMLIGSAVALRKGRLYPLLLTGAAASAIPDLDAFIRIAGSDYFFKYHRVFTHTIFAAPLLAALASLPAWIWEKKGYLLIYLLAFAVLLVHLGMDVLCMWPIRLFYPLGNKDYALNLFNNKDTSMIVLFIVTIATLGMLYYHNWMEAKGEKG